ncbi:MAG TPA: GatB/YqeY domain-containing protein, partial [Bacteroidales bacterium]|nr:GatB/YqeY domain-containing protein [Bacteroidales bacterium]
IKLLQKLVKQRKEAADIYQAQNREDLAKDELAQMEVIAQFLPAQLTEEEITVSIQQMIKEQNISGIKEMGKLMGIASKSFAGKADNKLVSDIVKRLLS